MKRLQLACLAAALALSTTSTLAQEVFRGKTIRIIAGSVAGGYYDNYARLMSRHLGDFLPGKPSVVVSNMPGASGVQAVNYIQEVAPKDGTVLATFNKSMPFYEAIDAPGVRFHSAELTWIGALSQSDDVVAVWHTTGVKSLADATKRDIVMGAVSVVGTTWVYPVLLNALAGTRIRLVTGYGSGVAIDHGIDQGELEGRGSNQWASWKSEHPDWVRDGKIIPIVQIGLRKEKDLPDVPLLSELAATDEQRALYGFVSVAAAIDGPLAGPPAMNADARDALRHGFEAMTGDPAFIADARKVGVDLDPLPPERVSEIATRIVSTPRDVIDRMKTIIAAKGTINEIKPAAAK
jgi:tripartite-type tricarboxylate transporter receptor subunit TctC